MDRCKDGRTDRRTNPILQEPSSRGWGSKKLNELVFPSSFIHLINSYLTDQYQFVQIEDKKSALAQVMCGVPQGSILGPILLNYINYISYIKYLHLHLHLHQVRVLNSLTALARIKDVKLKLKVHLIVLTLYSTLFSRYCAALNRQN